MLEPDVKVDENGNPIVPDKTVPYERFKEVNDKLHEVGAKVAELEKKGSSGLTPEQEKELQAKTYLKNLQKETFAEIEKEKQEAQAQEQRDFEKSFNEALAANVDVKREDFKKFLEENGDDFATVTSAMKHFKTIDKATKESYEKAKSDLTGKPRSPANEGMGGGMERPAEDKGKSIYEIAQEAVAALRKK